ncbi:MAG: hypothetical protein CMK07_14780 [Ponticaulis sp.]|nr:hypothetical protein [Ponticaulis sp.]
MSAQNEWQNYWHGRTNIKDDRRHKLLGEAYDDVLDQFWSELFSPLPEGARVLDLACGSGDVLKCAQSSGLTALTGIDISPEAIALLKENCPDVVGVASPLHDMPFDDGAFDIITSQFGFEYADPMTVVSQIASCLAPGGRFVALMHMTDGGIAGDCTVLRDEAEAVEATGFVPAAKDFFRALYDRESGAGSDAALNEAIERQDGPRNQLVALGHEGHPLAQHIVKGASHMFEERRSHSLDHVLNWFSEIETENRAHIARMTGMLSAAQSEADMAAFCAALEAQGLTTEKPEPFYPETDKPPIAWVMRAEKPKTN